jgi:peptide-methionine (S)-S-oxide reductase
MDNGRRQEKTMKAETITLAGGCFWCTEAVYEQVRGVLAVESGYSNGYAMNPTYEQVCGGDTGHAEVVRVNFDADEIPLRAVLEIFFATHDPTTLNRQGNDVGTQYRSGIYYESDEHKRVAEEVLADVRRDLEGRGERVVTELKPLLNYSRAETYHQHYFAQHPGQGYCAFVVAPKVEKFRKTFKQWLKG